MTEISCAQCRERLPLVVAGRLSAPEQAEVERHLAGCRGCRAVSRQWMMIEQALRLEDAQTPPDVTSAHVWEAIWRELPDVHRVVDAGRTIGAPGLTTIEREDDEMQSDSAYLYNGQAPVTTLTRRPEQGRDVSTQKHPRRRRLVLTLTSLAAMIAVVVGLLAVFGALLHNRTAQQPVSCAASQYRAHLPPYSSFNSISMAGPDEAWAIGDNEQQPQEPTALMAHLQNCQWKAVSLPDSDMMLGTIAMTGVGNGWVFGATHSSPDSIKPVLVGLHYTHGSWQHVALPSSMSYNTFPIMLSMHTAQDGWLLAGSYEDAGGVMRILRYNLFHYNGVVWTAVSLPFNNTSPQNDNTYIVGLASAALNDCWLVATPYTFSPSSSNLVAHYAHGKWNTQGYVDLNQPGVIFSGISFDSPTDGYLMGERQVSVAVNGKTITVTKPFIDHYDGAMWTAIAPFPTGLKSIHLMNIVVGTSGVIWVLGAESPSSGSEQMRERSTVVAYYQHGSWRVVEDDGSTGYFNATSSALAPFASESAWTTVVRYIPGPPGYAPFQVNQLALVDNGAIRVVPGQTS